ncbi:hypothetical protein EAI_00215, partial [Harpegnathos saltator]
FHPNLCHICKEKRGVVRLVTCNRCFMISYCSEDHKKLHFPQHRKFCTALEKFLKDDPKWFTRRFTRDEWYKAQSQLCVSVAIDLRRILEKYEIQMFIFARSCLICHQQTGLYSCIKCLSADYCLEHKEQFGQQHYSICDLLKLWLKLEFSNFEYRSIIPLKLKFMIFPDSNKPFNDMATFVTQYIREDARQWHTLDYIYTDYASGPMTIFYGIKETKLLNFLEIGPIYIIHVIDAKDVDRQSLPAWEILLHLIPKIKVLIIVMIGRELQEKLDTHDLCYCCCCNRKKLIYEFCAMSYSEYLSNPIYGKANLIVGFHATL